jgi:hypothetical protein
MDSILIWLGILFCVTQSAMFSGLNLAFFSLTRLRLEIEADEDPGGSASKVLALRKDSNFLLTTILWGNVGINVLLTLLSDSVMLGISSFAFSTGVITFFGEILPQAYFSRNALRMASMLSPVLKFYQFLLYPVAKPSAMFLDAWLGRESVHLYEEKFIKKLLKKHIVDSNSDIDDVEGTGAINFLQLDDTKLSQEGETLNPVSIIKVTSKKGGVVFPEFVPVAEDPFIQSINQSGKKWVIFTDEDNTPIAVLDADGYLRTVLLDKEEVHIKEYCHTPIIYENIEITLGTIIERLRADINDYSDQPLKKDVVLIWTTKVKKIITGADLLGRLLKGI